MDPWSDAHLLALGAWAGLVAAEVVVELGGRLETEHRNAVARFHHLIDRYAEIPLLVAIVVTGLGLLGQAALDATLALKVACALGAIGANAYCAVIVIRRGHAARRGDDPAVIDALTAGVFRTVYVGVPLALVALGIGGSRAGWW